MSIKVNIERDKLKNCLLSGEMSFESLALMTFGYQRKYNSVYARFLDLIGKSLIVPSRMSEIPYCPISLFKYCDLTTGDWQAEFGFRSSGTTHMLRSTHWIRSLEWYHDNARRLWEQYFEPLPEYRIVALLPNYHENTASSLLSMVSNFMKQSIGGEERYYIQDYSGLHTYLESMLERGEKVVLFGVSFALLDYLEQYRHEAARNLIVIETGGMKRYRKEVTRDDLHHRLREGFLGARICSEYGMTECQSQLYAIDGGRFVFNDRMRISIADPTDPMSILEEGRTGRIQIADLGNIDTMAFISTDDIGRLSGRDGVEILGRISSSDLRGCNYLI